MTVSKEKKKNPLAHKVCGWLIAAAIGIGLGIGGTLFIQSYNPPDKSKMTSPSVVFDRIVAQNEMVSVSQNYNITDKATDVNKLFDWMEIPFSENSFWYRYAGTIKAGVDMKGAKCEQDGNTIRITLHQPYIISNTPDMDVSGVLEEHNNLILNPIHVEDVDAFQRECAELSESKAIEGGLFNEAKAQAETNLKDMFNAALGDEYNVEVTWVEEQENE